MLPIRMGLISKSEQVQLADMMRVANALTIQLNRDLGPIWGVSGSIVALADVAAVSQQPPLTPRRGRGPCIGRQGPSRPKRR
jgi:hypothetical protein